MKNFFSVVLCLALFVSVNPVAFAEDVGTTYYIDSFGGNDGNSGTAESSAWKTLAKASSVVYAAGDKILLKAGSVFNGTFRAQGGGTAENPVTVDAYGDTASLALPVVRSDEDVILFDIRNVSGWCVRNLEFTAPNGKGVYITADGSGMTTDITVQNCVFHDIYYRRCESYSGGYCPIMLSSSGPTARLRNITLKDCNIYDCAYGVNMGGLTREWTPQWFKTPEESYNTGYRIEGVNFNNILYDGIIICSVYDMVIRDCALIRTSLNEDYYTAPMWSHHASNYLVENCEIAGSTNTLDGMAVDFDGWTTDAMYQYVYSHDNVRFIRNCCYDNYTKNENCTVRYCLSVNDNKGDNSMAQLLTAGIEYNEGEKAVYMDNFKFYNNTMINASSIDFKDLRNAYIANNIFTGNFTMEYRMARKAVDEETGKAYRRQFEGVFSNNCFWGTGYPFSAKKNFICDPGFVGTDLSDKNSFKLSSTSALLGKGIQVEDDMGTQDLYGNPVGARHNIGCYDGAGESDAAPASLFKRILNRVQTALGMVVNLCNYLSNCYWLF